MTYDELSEDEFLVKTQVEGLKKVPKEWNFYFFALVLS